MLLTFRASQGAVWQPVFQCLCDLPARFVAFRDQEADGRCIELNMEEIFFPLVYGFCNALGLIQNPTCYGKIQPARWSHDFSCDCCWAGGSPCEFHTSHQVLLVETASKSSWDFLSEDSVVERMGPVGRHIIPSPAILLLAISFWYAMSPPFPLEPLPRYAASKHSQGFQDSLNCSYSQDGGWDSHPTGPFPASAHRDLAPWLPSCENAGAWLGWLRICNDNGLVTS